MRRLWLSVLLVSGGFGVLSFGAWMTRNSVEDLRWLRLPSMIRRDLFWSFPSGTSEDDIRRRLENRGARLVSASGYAGCLLDSGEIVGSRHLRFALGGYRLLVSSVDVTATFCFDRDGQLLEIEVKKYRDAV